MGSLSQVFEVDMDARSGDIFCVQNLCVAQAECGVGRTPKGRWFADVEQVVLQMSREASSAELGAEILRRSATASPAMARRMAAAFRAASVFACGKPVYASIAAIEQLQAVANLDMTAADAIRIAVIAGNIPASSVRVTADTLRAKLSVSPEVLRLSWKHITDRCIQRIGSTIGSSVYNSAMYDDDIVEVDASYYHEDGEDIASYERRAEWALIISPHVQCARSKDTSNINFVKRVMISTSIFRFVSVFFSSPYEQNLIESRLRRYPYTWSRVWAECA